MRISPGGLAELYRQMATYLDAGMPILKTLESLSRQGRSKVRKLCSGLVVSIQAGRTFTEAAADTKVFPALHLSLFAAGERSGKLPILLRELAKSLEANSSLRHRLLLSAIYPILAFHAAVLVLAVFRTLMTQAPEVGFKAGFYPLQGLLTLVFVLGPVYGVVAIVAIIRRIASNSPATQSALDGIVLRVPVFGRIVRHSAIARFLRAMSCLYQAGVSMPEALETASGGAGNVRIACRLLPAKEKLRNGEPLSHALAATGELTVGDIELINTGCESGHLDEMLDRSAVVNEEIAQRRTKLVAALAPLFLFLCIGAVIVFFIFSIAAGYRDMLESLMN